jgi:hypothetical protein
VRTLGRAIVFVVPLAAFAIRFHSVAAIAPHIVARDVVRYLSVVKAASTRRGKHVAHIALPANRAGSRPPE